MGGNTFSACILLVSCRAFSWSGIHGTEDSVLEIPILLYCRLHVVTRYFFLTVAPLDCAATTSVARETELGSLGLRKIRYCCMILAITPIEIPPH